jgi:hypothetical protein
MKRFSKNLAKNQIAERAARVQESAKFDLSNGTAQLWRRGGSEQTKQLIDRAVSYGRMVALMEVAQDIDGGYIGYMTDSEIGKGILTDIKFATETIYPEPRS